MTRAGPSDISDYFQRSGDLLIKIASDSAFIATTLAIAEQIVTAIRSGNKLLIAGNGGSAADSQHIAAEFLSRFTRDRHPLAALALTTDTSVLTAIGNDFGFDRVFERQLRGLARPGDVFLAISTSGRSANIIAALKAAREIGVTAVGFTGNAGLMPPLCDFILEVPSSETALIQQVHIAAAHAICGRVEAALFEAAPAER